MDEALRRQRLMAQDSGISEAVNREYTRLRNFIRRRVADHGDAEDILQDVFYELVAAYRMMVPIDQVTAWLFRVARNRIIDRFRRRRREGSNMSPRVEAGDDDAHQLQELLPSSDAGPEAAYTRMVLLEELDAALDELPAEQREAFVEHELMGYSFKEMAARTGVNVNTLLSRKHYAVAHLRERLQAIYDEFLGK